MTDELRQILADIIPEFRESFAALRAAYERAEELDDYSDADELDDQHNEWCANALASIAEVWRPDV